MSTSVSVKKDYGSRWVYIGQYGSTTAYAKGTFSYSKGASTSLGVAVSTSVKAGSFKAGASKSRSSNATIGFAPRKGKTNVRYRTQFHYQKRLYTNCTAGWTCSSTYKIEPISWRGGTSTVSEKLPSATKCTPFEKGSHYTKTSTKAFTYSSGVSNSGMTVVNLSSRSGFNSKVTQRVDFTRDARLCGRNDYPAGNAKLLIAKPR